MNLKISVLIGGGGWVLFKRIVNEGIDARLEAFVLSDFVADGNRLYLNFEHSELQILLRRLLALEETDEDLWEIARSWVDDIVSCHYEKEIR